MTIPTKQEAFDIFWKEYPRKVAKHTASKKFPKALKFISFEAILKAVKAYAASVRGKEKTYILHAATWLHNRRWDDELEEPEFNLIEHLKKEKRGEKHENI